MQLQEENSAGGAMLCEYDFFKILYRMQARAVARMGIAVLGELSLGHAGFMSVGAFAGIVTTTCLADAIPLAPLRLAVAMIVGAAFAALAGVIVGVPVLRLKGDSMA